MEISAIMFCCENVLKDPFMTDLKTVVVLESIRYLLRIQVIADQSFGQIPSRGINEKSYLATSAQCQFMCLLRSGSFQPTVASKLYADRGFKSFDKVCNMSCFQKCVPNGTLRIPLVSLFLCKQRVGSHSIPMLYQCQCSFDVVV